MGENDECGEIVSKVCEFNYGGKRHNRNRECENAFEQLQEIVSHLEASKNFCFLAEKLSTPTMAEEAIQMIEAVVYLFNPKVSKKLRR